MDPAVDRLNKLSDEQIVEMLFAWRAWAREEQIEPPGDWSVWLFMAGRGSGKTRSGAEWIRENVERREAGRIALIAPTAADVRDTLIDGEAGILSVFPPAQRPEYEPSKRRVTFHTGARAYAYSDTEPERLRGPSHDLAWCDEVGTWKNSTTTWDNLMLGLRIGTRPRALVTTTPRPIKVLRDLETREGEDVVITRGSTYDNVQNLAEPFRRQILAAYRGARIERQEIYGELLSDMPGALWSRSQIDQHRVRPDQVPDLSRIVVAVDPSSSDGEDAAEAGIVVAGVEPGPVHLAHGYVLDDRTVRGSPLDWAKAAVRAYHDWDADRIVAEKNNGGEMVRVTLRTVDAAVPISLVWASRGKITRAEPVAALAEQGRIHHAGSFPDLEDQLCVYDGSGESPDRLDALVWAFSSLMLRKAKSSGRTWGAEAAMVS